MLGRVVDLLELVNVETNDRDMRVVLLHADHGVAKGVGEGAAIGQTGQRIVTLEIAHLLLSLPPLAPAHPGEGNGRRDAEAEQRQRHQGDEAEIAGEHARLIALVEIDDQRAARIRVEIDGQAQDRETR